MGAEPLLGNSALVRTVPDPEMGHLAGISFVEHFEVCVRVGSDNKIKLELSQLFYWIFIKKQCQWCNCDA